MQKVATTFKKFLKDESGQGATEYILLLVVVVGLALMFKGQIMEMVSAKLGQLKEGIMSVTSDAQ